MSKVNKCPYCGKVYGTVIPEGAKVCPKCLAAVEADEPKK